MLGYLASQPEVVVVVVCWDESREVEVLTAWGRLFMQRRGQCFYRSRRVTTLEPQDTLAAVSGDAQKVNLVGVRESEDKINLLDA